VGKGAGERMTMNLPLDSGAGSEKQVLGTPPFSGATVGLPCGGLLPWCPEVPLMGHLLNIPREGFKLERELIARENRCPLGRGWSWIQSWLTGGQHCTQDSSSIRHLWPPGLPPQLQEKIVA
jgi:hypothetical protein